MITLIFIFIIYATTALTQDLISSPDHYCFLKSPIDSSIFNFTNIQDDNSDSIISLNDFHHLRVHFCKPLTDPCNGKQGYSLCLHDKDKEIGVGKEPPKVAVESGQIMFKYVGDKCNSTHNYTVDIEMKCNIAIEKLAHDLDVVYNREQCDFLMRIETSAACPKRKEAECDLIDPTGYFNLRPLIDRASNYVIKLNDTLSVILNVCHSLLYGNHFHECNHETMACLIDETNPEEPRYTRLGKVENYMNFYAFDGAVYMDLKSDTPCDERNPSRTIRTIVEFICKPDATNTLPVYVSGFGSCVYKFVWLTAVGCNELDLISLSKKNQQPCKIRDPLDNQLFDVSKLRTNGSSENAGTDNAVYEFSVCGPLGKSHCSKSGTGVCKYIKGQKIGVSKGKANTNLMWKRNRIYLNYTDGIGCGRQRRSYTTIYFNCAYFDSVAIDDEDDCGTIITWLTPKICSHRCATPNYKYNLINLSEQNGNHHIRGETAATEYHMNICEPLFDEGYTNCTYGTGICKTILNDKGKRISELNLGSQESGLKRTEDGRFYLRYVNGSVCEEDKSKNITTEITFTCDSDMHAVGLLFLDLGTRFFESDSFINFQKLTKGTPIFKSYNNCKYDFHWTTSFVCPDSKERLSKECLVEDKYQVLNFTRLSKQLLFKLNEDELTGSFHVPVNGALNICSGTFMCDKESWEGKYLQPKLHPAKQLVAFQFRDENKCKEDTLYNTLVKVWCNVWAGAAESFLLQDEQCSTILELAKNKTLYKLRGNVREKKKTNEDDGSWSLIWLIIVGLVIIPLAIFGYYGYYSRGEMCLDMLRICYCVHIYRLVRRRSEPADDIPMQERF